MHIASDIAPRIDMDNGFLMVEGTVHDFSGGKLQEEYVQAVG